MTDILAYALNTGLSATIGQEFQYLFAEMGVAAAICLALGLVCVLIEIFVPGFGFFGITGIILLIVGMVIRVTDGGSGNPLLQLLILILILSVVCVVAFALMAYSAKKGWLSRTPFVMQASAVPTGITEGTSDYTSLIGREGVSVSMLRPAGIAEIDGSRYDVVAQGEFIEPNKTIIVESVEGVRIVVRETRFAAIENEKTN